MTVTVLMLLQICSKYILTCTFDRHQEGVHSILAPVVSFLLYGESNEFVFLPL